MKFFVSCPLGFEKELVREIQECLPFLKGSDFRHHAEPFEILELQKGGVLIETSLQLGLQINFYSKLAHRVLLRLAEFKAYEFFQLENLLRQKVRLEDFGVDRLRIDVECSQSKLGQEKKVLQTAEKVFGSSQEQAVQLMKIRIFQDLVSVSLDTSGDHLHKRGYRLHHGGAPLRENVAAFIIRKLVRGIEHPCPRGEFSQITLLDPFCGTGTLLLESATVYSVSSKRAYAFQFWKKSVPFSLKETPQEKIKSPFKKLCGVDLDPQVLKLAESSAQALNLSLDLKNGDFLNLNTSDYSGERLWILSNPPYGERLARDFDLKAMWQKCVDLKPQKIALILPEKDIRLLSQIRETRKIWSLSNGGIRVDLALWEF